MPRVNGVVSIFSKPLEIRVPKGLFMAFMPRRRAETPNLPSMQRSVYIANETAL